MGTQRSNTDIVFLSGGPHAVRHLRRRAQGHLGDRPQRLRGEGRARAAGRQPAGHAARDLRQRHARPRPTPPTSRATSRSSPAAPNEMPALTVNRLCGSGFQAVVSGAQEIMLGEAELCLVGGGESMSQAPHVARGLRWGLPLGSAPAARGHPLERAHRHRPGHGDGRDRREARRAVSASIAPPPTSSRCARSSSRAMRGRRASTTTRSSACRCGTRRRRRRRSFAATSTCARRRRGGAREAAPGVQGGRSRRRPATPRGSATAPAHSSSPAPSREEARAAPARAARLLGISRRRSERSWASGRCRRRTSPSSAPGSRSTEMDIIEVNEAFAPQVCAVERC